MNTVLVVDDEPKMRELLTRHLTPAGYTLKEAGDAVAALEIVRAGGVDVVVSDIFMPGKDGLWLVAKLRAEFPTVAIVLATADDAVPGAVALQDGVVSYLLKPYTAAGVLKAIKKAVDWRATASPTAPGADPLGEWLATPRRPRSAAE
jgi:CheY-like chemotaxis protein